MPSVLIPNGRKEEFAQIQLLTLGSTMLGFLMIAGSLGLKAADKVYR